LIAYCNLALFLTNSTFNPTCANYSSVNEYVYLGMYLHLLHNKLQYTESGDYCERVQPAQLPNLTSGSSSVSPGTTSKIHSPLGPRRTQQNYLVSDARLRRKECAPTRRRARESTTWRAITVRERADTASSASEREPTPPVQRPREQTPPVQGSRDGRPRGWGVR